MNDARDSCPPARRDFLKGILATVIGAILGLIPLGAGMVFFLDPLRRKFSASNAVRVTSLEALPNDGIPRKFAVLATRVDAWSSSKETPIGAVYLRRTDDGQVHAFNVVCPHAGCFVDFLPDRAVFLCPCHNSRFNLAGKVDDPA